MSHDLSSREFQRIAIYAHQMVHRSHEVGQLSHTQSRRLLEASNAYRHAVRLHRIGFLQRDLVEIHALIVCWLCQKDPVYEVFGRGAVATGMMMMDELQQTDRQHRTRQTGSEIAGAIFGGDWRTLADIYRKLQKRR